MGGDTPRSWKATGRQEGSMDIHSESKFSLFFEFVSGLTHFGQTNLLVK